MSPPVPKHPRQPLVTDEHGVIRFQSNGIIEWLFTHGHLSLNEIAFLPFDDADRRQLAQMLGYSASGYGDLSYVSADEAAEVDGMAETILWRKEHRCSCDHPPLAHCHADEIEPGGCTATDADGALCPCWAAPSSHLRRP